MDARTQIDRVSGPGVALVVVPGELHLHHDAEHRFFPAQHDDQIGAILGGLNLREVRRLDAGLAELR